MSRFSIVLSTCATAVLFGSGASSAQLASHGPPNEFGYPAYYTDDTGLSLIQGTDPLDPLLLSSAEAPLLPDPNGPLSVADGNFYGETFYWNCETEMATNGGEGSALIVMAIEGVWDNLDEAVVDGDQLVFSRLRIRVDVGNSPDNAGTYKITHPFGELEFEVTAADIAANEGTRVINYTDDCLHLDILNPSCAAPGPTAFSTPLDPAIATISRFLTWDAGAPPGYIGNPGIPHAVTGSPTGDNFFRIEGPNIGGPGNDSIETNLFLVAGKTVEVGPPLFQSLGSSMAGTGGISPLLTGTGDLIPGTPFTIDLTQALGSAPALYFVSPNIGSTPFLGGILIPDPATGERRNKLTNALGEIHGSGILPNVPSGTNFVMQFFVLDPGGPNGAAASNALMATVQ